MRTLIRLEKGRSLIAAHSLSVIEGAPWLVYLPESGADYYNGSRAELARLIGPALGRQFNYLAINKPGISPRRFDREAFDQSFLRPVRIADALATISHLIPKNAKIYLVGYSEGAYLAPQIAERDPRVVALALIGGGTRGWLKEELSRPLPVSQKRQIRREVEKILSRPGSNQKWQGFSYATWNSFRGDQTLSALKRLKLPTLAILGERDRAIDLDTTLKDLRLLSRTQPLQIETLPGCGHTFSGHWADVGHLLAEFFNPGAFNPDFN